jgi:hypothetical protein
MGILSAIFLGIAALGVSANSERASSKRINDYMRERCADGFERVTNKELEDQYYREALQLWVRSVEENNPDLFYPEKWEFFRAYPSHATDWAFDIACEKIIADGFAPWWVPGPFSMKRFGNHAWYRMAGGFDAEKEYYRDMASAQNGEAK